MDNSATQIKAAKGRPEALKLVLMAGLSVQVSGVMLGVLLVVLNLAH